MTQNKIQNDTQIPALPEMWDFVISKIYNRDSFAKELSDVLGPGKILDTCAGSGMPALELAALGRDITCVDGCPEMTAYFNGKAEEKGLEVKCEQMLWNEMGKMPHNNYDIVLCRGNSFSYAPGGWFEASQLTPEQADERYIATLQQFKDRLVPGGKLYVDKKKENEQDGRFYIGTLPRTEKHGAFEVYFEHEQNDIYRRARIVMKDDSGIEHLPGLKQDEWFTTMSLSESKLLDVLGKAGFVDIQKANIGSEVAFDAYIATKPE